MTRRIAVIMMLCVLGASTFAQMQHPIFTGAWAIDLDRLDAPVRKNAESLIKKGDLPSALTITQDDTQMVIERKFVKLSDTRIYKFDRTPYQSQMGPIHMREIGEWQGLRFVVTITSTSTPRTAGQAPAITGGNSDRMEISPEGSALSVSWPVPGKKNVTVYYKKAGAPPLSRW